MSELTVEMTYGRALYEAARDCGKADEIRKELDSLTALFKEEPQLYEFFCTPVISAEKKKDFVLEVFQGKLSQEMVNFLCVLADKRRGRNLLKIADQYKALMDEEAGFAVGEIYSVNPLSDEELARMEEEAGKLLRKKIRLKNLTDKSLVGGVKIFAEGKVIDASVKGQLLDMKNFLTN